MLLNFDLTNLNQYYKHKLGNEQEQRFLNHILHTYLIFSKNYIFATFNFCATNIINNSTAKFSNFFSMISKSQQAFSRMICLGNQRMTEVRWQLS